MLILAIVGGSILLIGLTFLYIFKRRTKIHAIEAVVADTETDLFHIFGYSMYMPDDSPSFDIYRHFVFNYSNFQITAGAYQQAKEFDIESEFVTGSLEMLSGKMGKTFILAPENEIRSQIKVIHRDLNAANSEDTSVIERIPKDAFVVMKLRQNELGLSKVSLEIYRNGIFIRRHVLKAWAEHEFRIFKTSFSNEVIMMYSKGRTNYGIAIAVIDLSSGDFVFNKHIT